MKYLNLYISLFLFSFCVLSCTDDDAWSNERDCMAGEPRYVNISFGNNSFNDIEVSTRVTSDGKFEHLIENFYVMIFKDASNEDLSQNTKVLGKFFDVGNKITDTNILTGDIEAWFLKSATGNTIVNGYKVPETFTHGIVRIKTPTGGPFKIYMIANIEAKYLQLSPQVFDGIKTEADMASLTLNLMGKPSNRTSLMMIGSQGGVSIDVDKDNPKEAHISYVTNENNKVPMDATNPLNIRRMDAKIEVRMHINTLENPKVKDFIPGTWQVINLPNTAKILESSALNYHPVKNEENFYNTITYNFERVGTHENTKGTQKETVKNHIFSFYMLENHPALENGKDAATKYSQRELRLKNTDGTYNNDNGMWKHAPETATYLKITGQIKMLDDPNNLTGNEQILFADVVYYIHLGDFNNNPADFNVKRNSRYTYNVTIQGVNKIKVEVEKQEEQQPGAAGDVYLAKEKVLMFDAHYGQHVMRFIADNISDNLTWYVNSPFTEGGTPQNMGNGVYISAGLDYKWVRFFRNIIKVKDGKEYYSKQNRWYPGDNFIPKSDKDCDRLMFIDQLLKYLKEQKHLLSQDKKNDFRKEIINGVERDVIYFTSYIDEYYYDKNPITLETDPFLWTRFINDCGDRVMHILCDNVQSLDKESSLTNSVYSIRQRPIQSPYTAKKHFINDKGHPITAWGTEMYDESGFDTNTGTAALSFPINDDFTYFKDKGYLNLPNGLFNTAFMAQLFKDPTTNNDITRNWSDFFNITHNEVSDGTIGWELPEDYDEQNLTGEKDNIHFLNKESKSLRYSFLLRNRDNDGDGVIDKNEIRWYIASLQQLTDLYIGGEGIIGDAQVYPDYFKGHEKWRYHVVGSTIYDILTLVRCPQVLWAEEGLSTSDIKSSGDDAILAVKCIRNLGNKPDGSQWDPTDKNDVPDELIIVHDKDGVVRVDAQRVNVRSLRNGSGPLNPDLKGTETSDEHGIFSFLPTGFELYSTSSQNVNLEEHLGSDYTKLLTSTFNEYPNLFGNAQTNVKYYDILKYILDNGMEKYYILPKDKDGKPVPGWRLPNLREIGILAMREKFAKDATHPITTTYFSMGRYGADKKTDKSCWYGGNAKVSLDKQNFWNNEFQFVFVRDWQPPVHID